MLKSMEEQLEGNLDLNFNILSRLYYLLRVLNTIDVFRDLPKQDLAFEDLESISNKLFKNVPVIGIIVEEQIKRLKEALLTPGGKPKGHIESSWRPLSKYAKQGASGLDDKSLTERKRIVRNFIAHAGFEYNFTMVQRCFDKIRFKYKSRKEVMNYVIASMVITHELHG